MLIIHTDQVPSLRSGRTDVQSPIRDKSSKPEGFSATSSEEGSDEDDPMKMEIGPIPEPADSNYIDDSSELSDVETGDAQNSEEAENDDSATSEGNTKTPVPGPHNILVSGPEMDVSDTNAREKPTDSGQGGTQPMQSQSLPGVSSSDKDIEVLVDNRKPAFTANESEQLRKNVQARAAAAVMEAASRSRASSEAPENIPANRTHLPSQNGMRGPQSDHQSRPNGAEHHRSRSDDNFAINGGTGVASFGGHPPSEVRKPSDLHNILNQEHVSAPSVSNENPADPYKRAEAIAAQMEGLKSRSASAPIHEGKGTPSPFPPPPLHPAPPRETLNQGQQQQLSPSLSHIMSPPVQSPAMMPPRSSSSTPVQADMERSSPKILGMVSQDKWQAVRGVSNTPYTASQTPRTSFISATSTIPSNEPSPREGTQPSMLRTLPMPSTQLGTPISDKQESFDVSQFRDSARGVRWSREGPETGFLRLTADAMRGWAETVRGSPLTATIEPTKILRIEIDMLDGDADKERVILIHKDGIQQMLVFETNSQNQRLVKAAVQRRRFVTWLRKLNSSVEYRNK